MLVLLVTKEHTCNWWPDWWGSPLAQGRINNIQATVQAAEPGTLGTISQNSAYNHLPGSFPLPGSEVDNFNCLVDHTVWSPCSLLILTDFAQILLTSVWGCHPYYSRNTSFCQFAILISKTVKNYEGYGIAPHLLANKLTRHTFMDILKEGVSWVRNKSIIHSNSSGHNDSVYFISSSPISQRVGRPRWYTVFYVVQEEALAWGIWIFSNSQEACLSFAPWGRQYQGCKQTFLVFFQGFL